ncbi:hypothetical protein GJ496_010200 [Pomphorhynchus laevis]|nr:hypothetical protein GJ496_010200 [Pomphorhynchus laevis]
MSDRLSKLDSMVISGDHSPIVIDIGHAYTKIGLAGDPAPRFMQRSVITINGLQIARLQYLKIGAQYSQQISKIRSCLGIAFCLMISRCIRGARSSRNCPARSCLNHEADTTLH